MSSLATLIGADRVAGTEACTPYDAWRLDVTGMLGADELALDVTHLNLDATSFRDLMTESGGDFDRLRQAIQAIVDERGKMHNPRTGSGGVLAGRVVALGERRVGEVPIGTLVVTLVSNTLVPLTLDAVGAVDPAAHQVAVTGRAILSPAARYAVVPPDLTLAQALALFDVCGVVPQVQRQVACGDRVVILGAAGRAGLLATLAAAERVGPDGRVAAVVLNDREAVRLSELPAWVSPVIADATWALPLVERLQAAWGEALADVVVDCTSASGTEVAAVACCRNGGQVCFFNMATSFQAAALGAEAVGRDVQLLIGFGLLPEAPGEAVAMVRRHPWLRARLAPA